MSDLRALIVGCGIAAVGVWHPWFVPVSPFAAAIFAAILGFVGGAVMIILSPGVRND